MTIKQILFLVALGAMPMAHAMDNQDELFDPARYKTEFPYEAFRVVTRADGFWAAKLLMSFSDGDIRAMVKAGQVETATVTESRILAHRRKDAAKVPEFAKVPDEFVITRPTGTVEGGLMEFLADNKVAADARQPSPLLGMLSGAGVLIIALFLTQYPRIHPMLKFMACGVMSGAPALLILIQPDMGECLVWIPVVFAMLFMTRLPLRYFIAIILIVAASMPVAAM